MPASDHTPLTPSHPHTHSHLSAHPLIFTPSHTLPPSHPLTPSHTLPPSLHTLAHLDMPSHPRTSSLHTLESSLHTLTHPRTPPHALSHTLLHTLSCPALGAVEPECKQHPPAPTGSPGRCRPAAVTREGALGLPNISRVSEGPDRQLRTGHEPGAAHGPGQTHGDWASPLTAGRGGRTWTLPGRQVPGEVRRPGRGPTGLCDGGRGVSRRWLRCLPQNLQTQQPGGQGTPTLSPPVPSRGKEGRSLAVGQP